jgi:hypothetical protein
LQNPYPLAESVLATINSEATKSSKKIKKIEFFYSEHIKITQSLRWTAAKSKLLYVAANSIFGLLLPVIPKPNENNSYRTIILIEFQNS